MYSFRLIIIILMDKGIYRCDFNRKKVRINVEGEKGMERYERIVTIIPEQMQLFCPIIFEKGALLRDNKLDTNVLQLQFKNIGEQKIKAIYVNIQCFDVERKAIEQIEKIYLDLEVSYGDVFGDRVPIKLENDTSRYFVVWIEKIIFLDESVSEYKACFEHVIESESLDRLTELKNQFIREVKNENSATNCMVRPMEGKSVWQCTCGAINFKENEKCGGCGIKKERLFFFLNSEFLKEKRDEYLKLKAQEEEEKKLQEERRVEELRVEEQEKKEKKKIRNKKIGKCLLCFSVIVVVLGIIYALTAPYIIPWIKYSIAVNAINSSDYEKGYQILSDLEDYRDSSEQILAGKYKEAKECVENEDYAKGCEIFESLGNYSDSKEQVLYAKYAEAEKYFDNEEYEVALQKFMDIVDFSDSKERIKEVRYSYAKELMNSKNYSTAMEEFRKLKSNKYEDSENLYKECAYQYANQLFDKKDYYEAITNYERAGEYKDTKNKVLEAKYQYCKKENDVNDYLVRDYIFILRKENYKDSEKLYEDITRTRISIVVNNSETDSTTNKSSLSRYDKWYFHTKVISCVPGKTVKLKYSLTFPDGGVQSFFENLKLNEGYTIYGWYSGNASSGQSGTATLKIYDENGTMIGSQSVSIY